MARQVVEMKSIHKEEGLLPVVIVYEEGMNKESIKQENRYTKTFKVLVPWKKGYEFKGEIK